MGAISKDSAFDDLKNAMSRGGVKIVRLSKNDGPSRSLKNLFAAVGIGIALCAFVSPSQAQSLAAPSPVATEQSQAVVWAKLAGHLREAGTPQQMKDAKDRIEKNFGIRFADDTMKIDRSDKRGYQIRFEVMVSGDAKAMQGFDGSLWMVRAATGAFLDLDRNAPAPRLDAAAGVEQEQVATARP